MDKEREELHLYLSTFEKTLNLIRSELVDHSPELTGLFAQIAKILRLTTNYLDRVHERIGDGR